MHSHGVRIQEFSYVRFVIQFCFSMLGPQFSQPLSGFFYLETALYSLPCLGDKGLV
jgi:hypothetical protein